MTEQKKTITKQLLEFIAQNGGASCSAVADHFGESRVWAHEKIQELRRAGYITSPRVETVYLITQVGHANLAKRSLTRAEHHANRVKREQRARDAASAEMVLISARAQPNSVFAMGSQA